jgi:outer membrane lipoprotein-sorting protein
MALGKGLGLAGVTLLASQALAAGQPSSTSAVNLLIRALDRIGLKNVVAVMEIPEPAQGKAQASVQVVKVVVSLDGRQKMTVLEPLQQSGLIVVQDGRTRQIFNPDTKTLSSVAVDDTLDPSLRRRLILSNYRVTSTDGVRIAGQEATRIDLKSKRIDGESTQVFVDPTSLFVLKVVEHCSTGQTLLRFQTRSVSYPRSLDAGAFDITTPQGVTSQPEQTPMPVRSTAEAQRRAGFRPVMPKALPYGFVVNKTYVKKTSEYRSVGFELTDGLAMAVVFEFPAKNVPASLKAQMRSPQSEFIRRGNLYIGVFTDLSPEVRKRLLAAYRH